MRLLIFSLLLAGCSSVQTAREPASTTGEPIEIAITLDDFPMMEPKTGALSTQEITHKMIDAFKQNGVSEVYAFENGIWETPEATDEPETSALKQAVRDWVAAGFPLGNHTYDHPKYSEITLLKEKREIVKNEKFLTKSAKDWKWFRYPYLVEGETQGKRDELRAFLKRRGYRIAQVTMFFDDVDWKAPYTRCMQKQDRAGLENLKRSYLEAAAAQLKASDANARQLFGRPIKQILLIHSGEVTSAYADDLLKLYKKMGARFITLADAESDPVYVMNPNSLGGEKQQDFLQQIADSHHVTILENTKMPNQNQFDAFCK